MTIDNIKCMYFVDYMCKENNPLAHLFKRWCICNEIAEGIYGELLFGRKEDKFYED